MNDHWLNKYNDGGDYILIRSIKYSGRKYVIYIKASLGEYDIVCDNVLYGGTDEINMDSFEKLLTRIEYIGYEESDFRIYKT